MFSSSLLSAFLFGASSITISIYNKHFLAAFRAPIFLCLAQTVTILSILSILFLLGFRRIHPATFSTSVWTSWSMWGVALSFFAYLFGGVSALSLLNVTLVAAIRRLATVFVIILEVWRQRDRVNMEKVTIAFLLLLSIAAAAVTSPTFDMLGVLLCVMSAFATTFSLLLSKLNQSKLDTISQLFVTSLMSLPFFVTGLGWSGEWEYVKGKVEKSGIPLIGGIVVSGILSLSINFASLWCTRTNTPFTTWYAV
uniref:Sugar phosphate transporter domain-containing protein n=1 Tax=Palpitomonas bilix TaxID=652834 RepID=A0A7S3G7Y3_9EUKA|mmetsp:Transcript_33730/g.86497  ORF Transcript_33730/g.86497 Transcript_33730/m.86497 type:complete len:253 (+) Transcript_33730:144-902(+)